MTKGGIETKYIVSNVGSARIQGLKAVVDLRGTQ